MLGGAMYTTIKTLWDKGHNKSEIARMLKHDWKTVAKVIKKVEAGEEVPVKKPHPKILNSYHELILELMSKGLKGLKIHDRLQEKGIQVAYSTVKDYVSQIKKREDIFVRIHTEPGEEAQVDFGYAGYIRGSNGKRQKTWVFNMRLSYSRLDYFERVDNQRVETFIQCHINAFRYFGGVPQYVKIDNLKAAILEANFYEPVYQRLYKNFSEHYRFSPQPCRVRHPNDKGKVESGIKYVKNNFFLGRQFKNSDDVDKQLRNWQEKVCNSRIHGTTRKIPREVFETHEKEYLKSLPLDEFRMPKVGSRIVYHDCHVFINYSYYSVPFEYVGKEIDIEVGQNLVRLYYQNKQIAIHSKATEKGEFKTDYNHYPKYKMYSATEYQEKYQIKMSSLGKYAEQLFFLILERQPRDWGRTVQGILSLSKYYPADVVNMSCKRALAYNVHQYQVIKNICKNGSYNLPLEFNWEETAL